MEADLNLGSGCGERSRNVEAYAEKMDSQRCEGEGDLRMALRNLAWTICGWVSHLLRWRTREEGQLIFFFFFCLKPEMGSGESRRYSVWKMPFISFFLSSYVICILTCSPLHLMRMDPCVFREENSAQIELALFPSPTTAV